MRVKIGPYLDFLGPYQIAEKIFFWVDKYEKDTYDYSSAYDKVEKLGKWLAEDKNGNDSALNKFCNWIYSKRKRTIKVHIDKWDSWSADSTLAIVILPVLQQLRATKHGSGMIDDADVPEGLGLRSTEAPPKENEWDTDDNLHKRYEWVLDEMIWAFSQLHPDCDWEAQYHSGNLEFTWEPHDIDKDGKPFTFVMKDAPNNTHKFDIDGYTAHQARITRGTILFGKYIQTLWD